MDYSLLKTVLFSFQSFESVGNIKSIINSLIYLTKK